MPAPWTTSVDRPRSSDGGRGPRPVDDRLAALLLAGLLAVGSLLGSVNLLVGEVLRDGPWRTVYAVAMVLLAGAAVGLVVRGRVGRGTVFLLVLLGDAVYVVLALCIADPLMHAPPLMLLSTALVAGWFLDRWRLGLHLLLVPVACWTALRAAGTDPVEQVVQAALNGVTLDVASVVVLLLRRRMHRLLEATHRLSATDPLTGLANRRSLAEGAHRVWRQAHRDGLAVVALVLDLDRFKQLNDDHGHAAGDAVLRAVADALTGVVRPTDVLARIGGEEMVVLGLVVDEREAHQLAERLHGAVRAAGPPPHLVTASVGLALCVPAADEDPGTELWRLVDRADLAMYRAKERGRDRIERALTQVPHPRSRPQPRGSGLIGG